MKRTQLISIVLSLILMQGGLSLASDSHQNNPLYASNGTYKVESAFNMQTIDNSRTLMLSHSQSQSRTSNNRYRVIPVSMPANKGPDTNPARLHLGYLAGAMNAVLGYIKVRIHNWKSQGSYYEIKIPDAPSKKSFDFPSYKVNPPKPFRDMRFYVNDINSEFFKAEHQGGNKFTIVIGFESGNKEIKGVRCKEDKDKAAPDAELNNIRITIGLTLNTTPDRKSLTYTVDSVDTSLSMSIEGGFKATLLNWLKPKLVREIRDKIKAGISASLLPALQAPAFRIKFEQSINAATKKVDEVIKLAKSAGLRVDQLRYRIDGNYLVVSIN